MVLIAYMAPVTCRVADGEENGFIFFFGLFKGFISPGIPVNGVVSVLEKVG